MTFFVDRSLGRYEVPRALRSAGFDVVEHDRFFGPETPDVRWIEIATRREWVVLSKDARLRRPPERDLILQLGTHVYVVTNAALTGPQSARLLVAHAERNERRTGQVRGGYVAGVYQDPPHLRWLVRRRR